MSKRTKSDEPETGRRDDNKQYGLAPDPVECAPAWTMVIFGANGDLTKRLLMPALYNLSGTKRRPAVAGTKSMRANAMINRSVSLAVLLLCAGGALAQKPAPDGMTLETAAKKRFPQRVRVGDLVGHTVLRPIPTRAVLGTVTQIVKTGDGRILVIIDYGGLFGIGAHPIAVPVEAMALIGKDMEVLDFQPPQLRQFPTFTSAGTTPVAADETIRVGLAAPSH